ESYVQSGKHYESEDAAPKPRRVGRLFEGALSSARRGRPVPGRRSEQERATVPQLRNQRAPDRAGVLPAEPSLSDLRFRAAKETRVLVARPAEDGDLGGDGVFEHAGG